MGFLNSPLTNAGVPPALSQGGCMKLIFSIGAIFSLAFVALALFKLWSVALFRSDVAICVWAFASALGLSLGLYAFTLRTRIAALEKRLEQQH
jgi:hypothetical protein